MQVIIMVLLIVAIILLVLILNNSRRGVIIDTSELSKQNEALRQTLLENSANDASRQRTEMAQAFASQTQALNDLSNRQTLTTNAQTTTLQNLINEKLDESLTKNFVQSFETVNVRMNGVEKQVAQIMPTVNGRLLQLQESNDNRLTAIQDTLDKKISTMTETMNIHLRSLQDANDKKLKEIQHTVDDQLQTVLQKRINESFAQVNTHLQSVQEGLGEMRTLAADVGGLKSALTGVKTRGIIGEIQLSRILEQIFTSNQYLEQANIFGDQTAVDFAIKLPGRENDIEHPVYLPIDSKFAIEDYQRLQDALTAGEASEAQKARKDLHARVKAQAKSISEKYIQPPLTTNYAIMFLPAEGLYAEIVSDVALVEELFNKYKINVAGPSTITALLNSLQIGFKTLQIEQRSSEVWKTLGEVKTEFNKYADTLEKVHDRIKRADEDMTKLVTTRTNVMRRKLSSIATLDANETTSLVSEAEDE
ncbi:DNA recombination protein RmuC [Weissella soli]|uniref:DNA recombination protein RmuC n=1 Tax=Weissella soli TaxID=155866 RepID=UPI0011BAFDB1|nr:DNA recombination protein RmuC [Weissella soli]QEA34357.1 DNA recombination protein RmuC [Weissella soli]GJM48595.1 hypothetical protein WSSLDB02_11520 [Weissella soli]